MAAMHPLDRTSLDPVANILVVDDDQYLRELLKEYLETSNFAVSLASSANDARQLANVRAYDIAIVDIGMPGEDGLSLARFLSHTYDTGIIILTGKDKPSERVAGLENGADDYVVKPFDLNELKARINSLKRRMEKSHAANDGSETETVQVGHSQLDMASRCLFTPNGERVHLTTMEFDLLETFVARKGRVLSREQLLSLSNSRSDKPYDRSIDNRISRIRRKIEPDPDNPQFIRTIYGKGYIYLPEGK